MTYPEVGNLSAAIMPDLMRYANEVTYGWFGITILIIVWLILFLSLMFADRDKAVSTATIIVALLAVPLRMISVVQDKYMFAALALGVLSIFWMIFQKEDV